MINQTAPAYRIFNRDLDFTKAALDIFCQQAAGNPVYRQFVELSGTRPAEVTAVEQVPFLPVQFFKTHEVLTGNLAAQTVFMSSGTTGSERSRHVVGDTELYRQSLSEGFKAFYGDPAGYAILAMIPEAMRGNGSSLAFMIDELIALSGHLESGYYYGRDQALAGMISDLRRQHKPTMLFGLSWALLDFAAYIEVNTKGSVAGEAPFIVMETGGMKGKRPEMVRSELHRILCKAFGVDRVHAEYGMTELLSQAYAKENGCFRCPSWMRILIRDANDPASMLGHDRTGGINIIDLANVHSCSFIATQDLGRSHPDGSFEVLGRFDGSDLRGCNLFIQ